MSGALRRGSIVNGPGQSAVKQPRGAREAVGAHKYWHEKFGAHGLLASSADLGWSGLSAELRRHDRGQITWKTVRPEAEICVAVCPSTALVTRVTGGIVDRTMAELGTVWFSPAGPQQGHLDISAPLPQILHVHLPSRHFSGESLGVDVDRAAQSRWRHEHSFRDSLVAEIAFAIVGELRQQTAGGSLLAETLAGTLAARLVHTHVGISPDRDLVRLPNQGLDRRRLTRVKEYIAANLEGDLTITELARVASLSRFHFARAFKAAVGKSPHQYVSTHRLERAKELLTGGDRPILDIALALNFSSQANFTRAFREGTGVTPGRYRRGYTQL